MKDGKLMMAMKVLELIKLISWLLVIIASTSGTLYMIKGKKSIKT